MSYATLPEACQRYVTLARQWDDQLKDPLLPKMVRSDELITAYLSLTHLERDAVYRYWQSREDEMARAEDVAL